MSESKSNQPLSYGQPVSEGDFSPGEVIDIATAFEHSCDICYDSGWLPAPDGFEYRCLCNPVVPDEIAA